MGYIEEIFQSIRPKLSKEHKKALSKMRRHMMGKADGSSSAEPSLSLSLPMRLDSIEAKALRGEYSAYMDDIKKRREKERSRISVQRDSERVRARGSLSFSK